MKHRDVEALFVMTREQIFGEAGGFAAEDEVIVGLVLNFGIIARAGGFDEPEAGGGWQLVVECDPIFPTVPFQVLPVIEAGAFEIFIFEFETERFDQVQGRAGGSAEARDVAGVGRDFRLEQDDVHKKLSTKPNRARARSCRRRRGLFGREYF